MVFLRHRPLGTLACLTCLLVTFLSQGPVRAQHQLIREVYDTKTNTWAKVTCLLGKLPAYGYAPIRVEINNGTKLDRELTLNFTSRDMTSLGNDTGSQMTSEFTCSCKAGGQETYDFIVPLVTIFQTGSYGSGSELNMRLFCTGYPMTSGSMSTETNDSWPSVLLSHDLYVPNASSLNSHISSAYSSMGNLEFAGDFDPRTLPTDWRSYMGQDVVMMTSTDWSKLDPGARTAILEWNRLGGHLVIYTTSTSDDLSTLQIDESKPGQKKTARSFGRVDLIPLPSSNLLNTATTQSLVSPHGPRSSSSQTQHGSLLRDYAGSWPLHITLGKKSFNTAFFILILLAFGILVGPVNLFVFAKSGKRHKLFITTPIISLGASALLIVIIMFQDGFGGRGHRLLLMEIQPDENKAYIIQEQAARTGVLLGNSFETSEPTLITPVALSSSRWSRVVTNGTAPTSYTANHGSKGLDVAGDWFQSRSIHGHLLKTVRPTRGRIELSPKAGAPVLISTFDFDLGALYYHAPDDSWWKAEALAKGNSVTLVPSNPTEFKLWLKEQSSRFARANSNQLNDIALQPGRFFTVTENATGIDTYDSIKWLTTTTVMTGPVSR
ncbi:MAG: hypothetical protein H7A51_00725 [Akkermansiaceae bacterium]|nr:hypothetical protein [Akkermansiaceae bacterium]